MKKYTLFIFLLLISSLGFSQGFARQITFDVIHVTNSSDAKVTAEIGNVTAASVVTLNLHGDATPISFSSSFSNQTNKLTITADNLSEGVYELHVSGNGSDSYSYVWVGKYGATTTLFVQPDANYGVDALLAILTRPGHTYYASTNFGNQPVIGGFNGTYGGYPNLRRGAIKFDYNGLSSAQVVSSELTLTVRSYRNQGYWGNQSIQNEVVIRQFENPWDENTISWSGGGSNSTVSQPVALAGNQTVIPKVGTKTHRIATVYPAQMQMNADMTSLVRANIEGGKPNHGYLIQLLEDAKYRHQFYYSSDYSVPLKRPKLTITFSLPEAKQFAKMKKKLDGGFVKVDSDRKLRFIYKEEYKDLDGNLTYNVYNDQHKIVMTQSDYNIKIGYGQNRETIKFDVCLATGGYYVLEIINEKNEKWYLRFKTEYDLEPNCPGYICPVLNCGVIITGPQN